MTWGVCFDELKATQHSTKFCLTKSPVTADDRLGF